MPEQIQKLKEELKNELAVICNLLVITPTIIGTTERVGYLKELCNYTDNDGWISGNGRKPDIPDKSMVIVKFRNRTESEVRWVWYFDWLFYTAYRPYDIIEYKIVGPR